MTEHGFNDGDRVVSTKNLGGSSYLAFGIVVRATRHTVKVQYYEPQVLRDNTDASASYQVKTCAFEEKDKIGDIDNFVYLRSLGYMGKSMRASLCYHRLDHFEEGHNYDSTAYY